MFLYFCTIGLMALTPKVSQEKVKFGGWLSSRSVRNDKWGHEGDFFFLQIFFTLQFFRANYSHFLFAKIALDSLSVRLFCDYSKGHFTWGLFLLTLEHLWNVLFNLWTCENFCYFPGKVPRGKFKSTIKQKKMAAEQCYLLLPISFILKAVG